MSIEQRCKPLDYWRVESASLNGGTTNLGEAVYINTFEDIRYCAKAVYEREIIPEIEVFDIGMIYNIRMTQAQVPYREPVLYNLVFGHRGGMQANMECLTAFLAACLIPSAGMLLLPQGEAAANQTLAPAPRLFLEDGSFNTQVLDEVTDYVADHFAFRQEMITAGAALDAAVFHVSSEEDVVLGREDWLFYRETLDDCLHTNPLSEQQLFGAARTLALLQEYAQSRGARLYVTVAPNKASLYPEYLPNVGEPLAGEDDIDRLLPYLEGQGVPYIDLFAPFRETDEVLYYHTDSHWNMRGAALC